MVTFYHRLKVLFLVLLISHMWVYQGGQGKSRETRDLTSTEDKDSVQTQLSLNLKQRSFQVFHSAELFALEDDVPKERKASEEYGRKRASHRNDEEHEASVSGLHFLKTPQKLSTRRRTPRNLGNDSNYLFLLLCEDKRSCFGTGKCKAERDPGSTYETRKCFCDKYCELFQDCCADYAKACVKNTRPNSSATPDGQWQCNEGGDYDYTRGVWMISSCPRNWSENNITNKCIAPAPIASVNYMYKDIVPVIDEKGNTYKNRFCALCHGIQANETHFFDVQQRCENKSGSWQRVFNISEAMLTNCSHITWKPRPGFTRRYCLQAKGSESCSLQSPTLRELCSSSIPGIVLDDQSQSLYMNKYCALCSNKTGLSCGLLVKPIYDHTPLSTVLEVEHTIYNPKIIHCPDGHVFDNVLGKCIPTIQVLPRIPFLNRHFIVIKSRLLECCSVEGRIMKIMKEALEIEFKQRSVQLFSVDIRHTGDLVYVAYLNATIATEINTQPIINSLLNSTITSRNVSFLVTEVTWKPLHCYEIRTYKPGEYEVDISNGSEVYIKSTGEILHEVNYYTNQTEKKNGSSVPVGNIYVCRNQLRFNCSGAFIALSEHDYVILPNGFLYRNLSKMVYRFERVNGSAIICVNYSAKYTLQKHPEDDLALDILTHVGFLLSIPCLLFVLVTYSLFKELRTLPGVNLMSLSLSLLFAHSLFLGTGATHVQLICTVIAALLHYFYLVSFVWMSIIAFDTYRAFSRTCPHQQRAKTWRFIAMGWLPALVFVAICVSLDQFQVVDIEYGGSKSCWINNGRSNLYFFVVPVAFSVVFNVFFFILTVHSIRKTKQQTQRVNAASKRQSNFKLFLKLAILMGFTWIFGFLKLLVSDYFAYPFVIFSSLQGVYIAVAFVFTSRVKRMYCQLFGGT